MILVLDIYYYFLLIMTLLYVLLPLILLLYIYTTTPTGETPVRATARGDSQQEPRGDQHATYLSGRSDRRPRTTIRDRALKLSTTNSAKDT